MKALPLVTLALCAGFLIFQRSTVSSITKSNTILETRVTQAESSSPTTNATADGPASAAAKSSRRGSRPKPAGATSPLDKVKSLADLDLEDFVEAMRKAESGGGPDFKAMIRIRSLLLEATPREISDLIKRTAALDVPSKVKRGMIGQFVQALAEQDPRAALDLAFDSPHLDIGEQRWHFSHSFSRWVDKEPAAAVAWFDRQLAKGTFESKSLSGESDARREFESAAIGALARSDLPQAQARLLNLPEEERQQILSQGHRFGLKGEKATAYAQLIRESLPEDQQAGVLGSAGQHVMRTTGYEGVTEFANTVNASPSERSAIVRSAAIRQFERMGWEDRTPKPEDVSELRTFLQAEAPAEANRLTGEALAASAGGSGEKLDVAIGLLREVHAENADDQLIVGFIENGTARHRHQDPLRELAQEISDPAQRQATLEKLDQSKP